jgi:hypothetical protein
MSPSSHDSADKSTLDALLKTLPLDGRSIELLKTQDFEDSFPIIALKQLKDFVHWSDRPDSHFLSKELHAQVQAFRTGLLKLLKTIGKFCFGESDTDAPMSPLYLRVPKEWRFSTNPKQEALWRGATTSLNNLAERLYKDYGNLVKAARAHVSVTTASETKHQAEKVKIGKEGVVYSILRKHPDWTAKQIAERAGVQRTSLYRMETFKKFREIQKAQKKKKFGKAQWGRDGTVVDGAPPEIDRD